MMRSAGIVLVLAAATLGEGGASARSLLAQHAVLLALALAALATPHAESRLPRRVTVPFAVFLGLALAGALLAPYAYAAWLVVVEIAAFSFVAWLAASVGAPLWPRLALGLSAVAVAASAWAVVQRASGALRPSAGFLNPNHLAAWLVAVLFVAGGVAMSRGRSARIAFAVLAAIALVPLVLIGSRAAAIGVVAGAIVVVATGAARRALVLGLCGLTLAVGLGVAMRFRVHDPFGLSRIAIWRASLAAVAGDPLWGTKPGQFEAAARNLNFPLEGAPLRYERAFGTPHSDLLRAPCEFGLPASLALAVAAVGAALSLRRRLGPAEVGALAAVASLVAQGAVGDLTEAPAIYLLGGALLGALLSAPSTDLAPRSRALAAVVAVALVVVFAVGEIAPFRAWSIQARLPRGALTPAQRADLELATALNAWHPDLRLRRVADLLEASGWTAVEYASARETAEAAIRLDPASANAWRALAHVEGKACLEVFRDVATRARAERAFAHAAERSRHDPFIPLDAARFLLAAGDPEGARRQAERALAIEPNAIAPRLTLATALERAGGADAAARAAALRDEAAELARRFAGVPKESPYARRLLTLDAPAGGD